MELQNKDLLNLNFVEENIKKDAIRFDGYFNNETIAKKLQQQAERVGDASLNLTAESAKKSTIIVPMFFFANGTFSSNNACLNVNETIGRYLTGEMYTTKSGFGKFSIDSNGVITVIKYKYLQNKFKFPRWENKLVKYQGKLKNDTSIINWHQVAPFPNTGFDEIDTIPQVLVFQTFESKKTIDSLRILKMLND